VEKNFSKRDLFVRIKTTYRSLSQSEKKVGEYILNNANKTMGMTLAEVAAASKVSDATALRFSRSLGYRGWLELRVALIRSVPEEWDHPLSSGGDDRKSLFSGVIEQSKLALDETFAAFDEEVFRKVVQVVMKAEKVLIVGSGTSGPVVQDLYNRLFRLGIFCSMETDGLLQIMQASLLSPRDIVIVISQSGEAESILRTVEVAQKSGAGIVTITVIRPGQAFQIHPSFSLS
jgi:RpiR family carbohydrate utilization transcriptional regulator